jgi:hypothetical protein
MELTMLLHDSILNQEKIRMVQKMGFNEQIRQQEIEEEKSIAESERKQNLQLLGIAVFIILLVLVVLLLSKSPKTQKVVNFLGVLALLLFFEYLSLLIHPRLEKLTHHTPILMILILVLLGSFLVPLHHRLEKYFKEKFLRK